jgi:hypothetical protein
MTGFEMRRKLPNRIWWTIFRRCGSIAHVGPRAIRRFAALGCPNPECRFGVKTGHSETYSITYRADRPASPGETTWLGTIAIGQILLKPR